MLVGFAEVKSQVGEKMTNWKGGVEANLAQKYMGKMPIAMDKQTVFNPWDEVFENGKKTKTVFNTDLLE